MHDQPYDREMRSVDWGRVFDRQQLRSEEIESWLDALELEPESRLLDLGSGPGFTAIQAARRIGSRGKVIAVDRSEEALAFLRGKVEGMAEASAAMAPIETIVADGEDFTLEEPVDAALLTHVLHHTDAPRRVIATLYRTLVPGGRAVVAEFDPDAAGEVGPPLEERIPRDQLRAWLREAGFEVERAIPDGREQYAFLVRRPEGG